MSACTHLDVGQTLGDSARPVTGGLSTPLPPFPRRRPRRRRPRALRSEPHGDDCDRNREIVLSPQARKRAGLAGPVAERASASTRCPPPAPRPNAAHGPRPAKAGPPATYALPTEQLHDYTAARTPPLTDRGLHFGWCGGPDVGPGIWLCPCDAAAPISHMLGGREDSRHGVFRATVRE